MKSFDCINTENYLTFPYSCLEKNSKERRDMATKKKATTTNKKATTKTAPKKASPARTANGKYSFIDTVHQGVLGATEVARSGEIKLKKTDLKGILEGAFEEGAKAAAGGERVRFPVIGALVRKDVPARKSRKGANPFTGEEIMIKARKESKKPRWSFPKTLKDTFANKRFW
jgi:DNA-binding protein HU-beta